MQRRTLFPALSSALAASGLPAADGWSNPFAKAWHRSFLEHWKDTREYTLAMLDAMPEEGFPSRPDPAQRTFGEQMLHLAVANTVYFRGFGLLPVPEAQLTADRTKLEQYARPADKTAVRRFVAASFDYVQAVLDKMSEKDLSRTDIKLFPSAGPHTAIDVCLRAYMHTAHHRGQTVAYLRVRGIVPPAWKFEPTA